MVAARVILSLAFCCAPAAGVLPWAAWSGASRAVPGSEEATPALQAVPGGEKATPDPGGGAGDATPVQEGAQGCLDKGDAGTWCPNLQGGWSCVKNCPDGMDGEGCFDKGDLGTWCPKAEGGWYCKKNCPAEKAPEHGENPPSETMQQCSAVLRDAWSEDKAKAQTAYTFLASMARKNLSDVATGRGCLMMLQGILNNPLRGPWLAETDAQSAVMDFLRLHKNEARLNHDMCFLIGGGYSVPDPVSRRTEETGGFAHLFEQIGMHDDSPDFQMQMYRALSDPSYTEAGAHAIANVALGRDGAGGPYAGIRMLVNEMRTHPKPHLAESPADHLTLKYEIMQVLCGILSHDAGKEPAEKRYTGRAVESGFLDQVIYSMRAEPDLRGTTDVACKSAALVMDKNKEAARSFISQGGVRLIRDALETFHDDDFTPLTWGHKTLGKEYPVVPNCIAALGSLTRTLGMHALDAMRGEDMAMVLGQVRPEFTAQVEPLLGVLIGIQRRSTWNQEKGTWDPPALEDTEEWSDTPSVSVVSALAAQDTKTSPEVAPAASAPAVQDLYGAR